MPIHGNLAPGLSVGTAVVANFDREYAALTGSTNQTGEVVEPGSPGGLLQAFTSEGQTSGVLVASATQPPLIGSAGVTYQTSAAVHGSIGIQVTGASSNFRFRAPGHSFHLSLYGSLSVIGTGTISLLNIDDETLATALSGVAFVGNGTTGNFTVSVGVTSSSATGTIAVGDQFRLDLTVNYNNGTQTNTLDIYYRTNIEGSTPDETITATHSVSAPGPWLRFGSSAAFTLNLDTIRVYDFASAPAPFAPAIALSGSGTLAVTATTPALAGSAALGGSGTLAVTPVVSFASGPALSGSGSLGVTGIPSPTAAPTLSGSGSLVTTRTPGLVASPALAGTGTLAVTPTPAIASTAALSGAGTLAVTVKTPALVVAPALGGTGTLAVSTATPAVATSPALGGTGTLNASSGSSGSGTPALGGTGTLAAAGTPALAKTPALSGTGTLNVAGPLGASSPATLSGTGTLLVTLTQTAVTAAVALLGTGTLAAARPPSAVRAYLAAAQPDNDPGAVAALHNLNAWANRRRVRHGESAWLGPITISPGGVVLTLAVAPGTTAPADGDWTLPTYVAGRPGYLLNHPAAVGTYSLWARDGAGTPARFATITVT